jgi:hypothetical protein
MKPETWPWHGTHELEVSLVAATNETQLILMQIYNSKKNTQTKLFKKPLKMAQKNQEFI